jgi:hypothetical protein
MPPARKARQPGRPKLVPALALRVWFEASRFFSVHGLRAREERGQARGRLSLDQESSVAVRTPPALPAGVFRLGREWAVHPEPRRRVQADRRDELHRLAVRDSHTFRGKKKGP